MARLDTEWVFSPINYGFSRTLDPWIFEYPLEDGSSVIASRNTLGIWEFKRRIVEDSFMADEIIYHGKVSSRDFMNMLISNTELEKLLYE